VPTTVPHNATAVVQFGTAAGTLAKGPGGTLNPTYTAATLTCNSVYRHGTTPLGGAASKNPAWTTTYATGDAICGTCHFRSNPPAPHPATAAGGLPITSTTQCIQCHPGTVLADGTINVANDLHINGVKDVDYHPAGYAAAAVHGGPAKLDLAGCKTCHGADLNGAPASNGTSCNACHAANGASGWQTNCTLCHGEPNRAPPTLPRTTSARRRSAPTRPPRRSARRTSRPPPPTRWAPTWPTCRPARWPAPSSASSATASRCPSISPT
jgi:predicted CxxxxCH...CXXCH cytochrome family protein